jgi:NADH dehydrogenase [ubiquinone] 1 alpha subcomplex assembly factor 6
MATIVGSKMDTTGSEDPTGYCKEFVRKHDYESFLISPFYPKEMQPGYFALKAFYVSISDNTIYVRLTCAV